VGRLVSYRDRNGVTVISGLSLVDVQAGGSTTPRKMGIRNIGDVVLAGAKAVISQSGINDGNDFVKTAADAVTPTLPAPHALVALVLGSGGSFATTGLFFYVITAFNASGETGPSQEVSANVDVVTKSVALGWNVVSAADGYKIYRGTSSGAFGSTALLATINNPIATGFTDTGTATSAGSVPTANTTAGSSPNFGTIPADGAFAQTPIVFGDLALGEEFFIWLRADVPAGITDDGNSRRALIEIEES